MGIESVQALLVELFDNVPEKPFLHVCVVHIKPVDLICLGRGHLCGGIIEKRDALLRVIIEP